MNPLMHCCRFFLSSVIRVLVGVLLGWKYKGKYERYCFGEGMLSKETTNKETLHTLSSLSRVAAGAKETRHLLRTRAPAYLHLILDVTSVAPTGEGRQTGDGAVNNETGMSVDFQRRFK